MLFGKNKSDYPQQTTAGPPKSNGVRIIIGLAVLSLVLILVNLIFSQEKPSPATTNLQEYSFSTFSIKVPEAFEPTSSSRESVKLESPNSEVITVSKYVPSGSGDSLDSIQKKVAYTIENKPIARIQSKIKKDGDLEYLELTEIQQQTTISQIYVKKQSYYWKIEARTSSEEGGIDPILNTLVLIANNITEKT
jgi:hypothetical protein